MTPDVFLFASAFLLPKESFAAELFSTRIDAFLPLKRRRKVSIQRWWFDAAAWTRLRHEAEQRLAMQVLPAAQSELQIVYQGIARESVQPLQHAAAVQRSGRKDKTAR